MQASPVQSSWVILCQLGALLQQCKAHGSSQIILCQLGALLQQCKAHGSFCANSGPSCKSAKLMGHSVPTRSPPASVSSAKVAWWTHLESRCKQESQQREQRSERSERLRHTTTHLEPSCKHLEPSCKHLGPSCKHLQCKGRAKAAWWTHLQCKAHGSFCANLEPSCKSAKLMDHSVPTRSPPATVQSSWVILCQLGALLQKCKAHGSFCANSEPSSVQSDGKCSSKTGSSKRRTGASTARAPLHAVRARRIHSLPVAARRVPGMIKEYL